MNGSESGEAGAPDYAQGPGDDTIPGMANAFRASLAPAEAIPEAGHQAAGDAAGDDLLDLPEANRLPWLESADDDDLDGGIDTGRVVAVVVGGLALLAAIVGGVWWGTHRNEGGQRVADGSLIHAPAEPYKAAPQNPGGKTYDGTGDSSFAVSQGHNPAAHLAGASEAAAEPGDKPSTGATTGPVKTAQQAGAVAVAAAKAAGGAAGGATGAAHGTTAPAAAHAGGAAASSGVGVQVGAYTSQAGAEAGWAKLEKQYESLASLHHRIVQGQADIGTVYRLQAVAESDSAASSLCASLKGQGLACQVRH